MLSLEVLQVWEHLLVWEGEGGADSCLWGIRTRTRNTNPRQERKGNGLDQDLSLGTLCLSALGAPIREQPHTALLWHFTSELIVLEPSSIISSHFYLYTYMHIHISCWNWNLCLPNIILCSSHTISLFHILKRTTNSRWSPRITKVLLYELCLFPF